MPIMAPLSDLLGVSRQTAVVAFQLGDAFTNPVSYTHLMCIRDRVEMDPMVVEACRAYLPGNACRLDDRRVHLHYENALKYIRRCERCV